MTTNLVITSGRKYIDIDAYAGIIAYRELLRAGRKNNVTASTLATLNQSIPPLILNLKYHLDSPETPKDAKYIILDTSNPEFFDERITTENLIEIIDHHTGFENYWKGHPNIKTQIEFIGSVCTIIFEKIISSGHTEILDADLCKLLIAGILDNTLNLKSSITTDRDHNAYDKLMKIGNIPDDFYAEYFSACESEILKDFKKAIKDDLKIEKVGVLPEVIGQMIIINAANFDREEMKKVFAEYPEWLMNVISLENGKSYLYFGGKSVRRRLEKLFNKQCIANDLLILDNFLLRKQIMKKARDENHTPFILTFGSCGWDRIFAVDENGNEKLIYEEEGRKNSHQAVAAKRAGASSMLISFVGDDDIGTKVLNSLNDCGIDTRFVEIVNGVVTEVNHQLLDEKTKDYSLIRFPSPLSQYYNPEMVDKYKHWILKAAAVILVSKQNKDFLETIIDFCHKNNILTTLTISHEKFNINDKKDLKTLNKVSFIVGNYKEASLLTKLSDINQMLELLPNLIITKGNEGVFFVSDNKVKHEPSIKVDNVVETNGAGDTFLGYFITNYVMGEPKLKCIRMGQCAAALEIQKMGVLSAMPYAADVEKLYNKTYDE